MKRCGVILAAGSGSRFVAAEHKLMAQLGNEPVVVHAVRAAAAAELDELVVVTGAEPRVEAIVAELAPTAHVVRNDRWAEGQATSLRVAVDTARELGCDRLVIGLGDQPAITTAAWNAVGAVDGPVVVATYAGRRGHPVLLRDDVWADLPSTGDSGARALIGMRPDLVREVPCQGSPADVDTVEDLQRWQNSSSTNSP